MMPSSAVLPAGVDKEALLTELRRLSWGAADILRAYARGEQPPHGFPKVLSVDEGGEGPVSAADLAVSKWLLDGLSAAFPKADWTLLSEETARSSSRKAKRFRLSGCGFSIPWMAPRISCRAQANTPFI